MRQYRILIIDDDKLWLSVISRAFVSEGFEVCSALSGAEGVNSAMRNVPDVIILDFHLEGESAVEVCGRIRSETALRDIPVVIASNDDTIDQAAYFECGAVSFVLKFGDLRRILANVENLLRHMERARGVIERGDIYLEPDGFRVYKNKKLLAKITAEQYKFLALLIANSPEFIKDEDIAKLIFSSAAGIDRSDAIRGLAHRTRKSLGLQTGRRIKNKIDKGWIYILPRDTVAD